MRRELVLLVLIACGKHAELDRSAFDEIDVLDSPPGVSDLAIDDHGTLWAIPERDRVVLEIPRPGARAIAHPLVGVADGIDTEAIAWVAPGRFALGTEGQHAATASVLDAALEPDGRITVTAEHPLTGISLEPNKGAEGICGRAGDVLVAIETVGTLADGTRYAPLVRIHDGQQVAIDRLRLTSKTGKIAALACSSPGDVYAIERHYGTSKLLHFADTGGEITPTVVIDLYPIHHGTLNLEGLARLPDGRFAFVNDNQSRTIEGPTELLVLRKDRIPGLQPRSCVACSSRSSSSRTRPGPIPPSSRSTR
ncbi:MAG: SdiA-regulated domain-containing protein [Acidobacteriota bacterium]